MSKREISLDTETTGLDPYQGDRLIEIGAIELIDLMPTGKTYHQYINPQCLIKPDAEKVHGINNDFVADKPLFKDIAPEFMDFIGESPLVIHNAKFDMKFLDYELELNEFSKIKNTVIDTVVMARKKFPGSRVNLDALCKRFNIDNSNRELHGALIDADLLAQVYLELQGGKYYRLNLDDVRKKTLDKVVEVKREGELKERDISLPSKDDFILHQKFLADKIKGSLWSKYI